MKRLMFVGLFAACAVSQVTAWADEQPAAEAPAGPEDGFLKGFDLDEDGSISWTEFQKVRSGFAAIDTDRDGSLSKSEVRVFVKRSSPVTAHGGQMPGIGGFPGMHGGGAFPGMQGMPGMGGFPVMHGGGTFPGMQGMPGMGGFPGMHGGGSFPGMRGMPGMGGFPGMHGGGAFPGMPGMPGMGGFPGMHGGGAFPGMQGMPGMSGFPGMHGSASSPGMPGLGGRPGQFPGAPHRSVNPPASELVADGAGPVGRTPGASTPPPVVLLAMAADRDRSMSVSSEEWTALLDKTKADTKGAIEVESLLSGLPPLPPGLDAASLVKGLDHDQDGAITRADLNALFTAADADKDGSLTMNEVMAQAR